MRNKIMSFVSCGLALTFSHCDMGYAFNNVCSEGFGTMRCTTGEVDSITYLGNTILSGTHVIGGLNITGNLQANNAEVGSANLTGNIEASHLTVHNHFSAIGIYHIDNSQFLSSAKIIGNLRGSHDVFNGATEIVGDVKISSEQFKDLSVITGKIDAESSSFSAPITLNACIAKFHQSSLSKIEMTKQKDCIDQKIYLNEKTMVNGNIAFLGGNGKVFVSKDSLIHGQVSGGVIVNEA